MSLLSMSGGKGCFKEKILSVGMGYMGKGCVGLIRSRNERIFSHLTCLYLTVILILSQGK